MIKRKRRKRIVREEEAMGWVWKDDDEEKKSGEVNEFVTGTGDSGDRCSTRKIVRSNCRTEEVEPGKFVRKCEKTEQLLRDCAGRLFSLFIIL